MAQASRDQNRVTSLLGANPLGGAPVDVYADSTTHALYVYLAAVALTITTLETTPTTVGNNQKNVTTAGTQVQLQTNSCLGVTIKAKSTNTGLIYVGDSAVDSATGFILSKNESVSIAIDNTNKIWIDSSVNGEGVSWFLVFT